MPLKVCIVGSGNWGSAIAKLIGYNAERLEAFETSVTMYVYEENINGRKLTEIINETHENVKYLPGHKLPTNVFAEPDLTKAVADADILVFVVPHQFVKSQCLAMKGRIKSTAVGLSLIKGINIPEGGGIELISQMIKDILEIDVSVLMGANIASEVADEKFCESTIGSRNPVYAPLLRDLIQTENFSITIVDDVETVELCGALKNVVACAAGMVDGLNLGDNTKAAVIRLGLLEMIKFSRRFNPNLKLTTFFQSCGVADLVTTCYGGRNRKVCEAFVKTGKTIAELEEEMLNGQKLQGPETATEVNVLLKQSSIEDEFPLFTTVHLVCTKQLDPTLLIDRIKNQPEHLLKI